MVLSIWSFCKFLLLSGYTQIDGIKGIPKKFDPKIAYYFTNNSNDPFFFQKDAFHKHKDLSRNMHKDDEKFSVVQVPLLLI